MSQEVIAPGDTPTPGEQVAEEVRAQAARKRVTGARLATAAHMSAMSMSRRITGRQPFDVDELAAIADELGVHMAVLVGGRPPEGWRPPKLPQKDSNFQPTGLRAARPYLRLAS